MNLPVHLKNIFAALALLLIASLSITKVSADDNTTRVGFVLHFDHFSSSTEALSLIDIAIAAGAHAFNVVPPAHVWDSPLDLTTLDQLINTLEQKKIPYVISRVDAMYLPVPGKNRSGWLYSKLLTSPGQLPDGQPTNDWFCATVNIPGYVDWMEQETSFYAKRYGKNPGLSGFNVGMFSEPFVSQRGSFFEYSTTTDHYEVAQYTPSTLAWWQHWLKQKWKTERAANTAYGTAFASFADFPMPTNEKDPRFQNDEAYSDFLRSLNDWFEMAFHRCQKRWNSIVGKKGPPFILQMSGYDAEKFEMGRPAAALLDWRHWLKDADAIGLSIYTNDGYPDYGHKSISSMVDTIRDIADHKKNVFVMESGCEAPLPVLNTNEWSFIGGQASRLNPKMFFYEFLKIPYYNQVGERDGHLIMPDGRVNEPVEKNLPVLFGSRT